MDIIYTIGANKKTAEEFFSLLRDKHIELIVDVRLNNKSQLAGFTKEPNLEFFLRQIAGIDYIWDIMFAPSEETFAWYKNSHDKSNVWERYTREFYETMQERDITDYIKKEYSTRRSVCLLCSEESADYCHRRLVAAKFKEVWPECDIVHL